MQSTIYYRIWLLNSEGCIVGARYACRDRDEEALAAATAIVTAEIGAEVWDGNRLVGSVATDKNVASHPNLNSAAEEG